MNKTMLEALTVLARIDVVKHIDAMEQGDSSREEPVSIRKLREFVGAPKHKEPWEQ